MDKLTLAFQYFDEYNKKDPHIFIWKGENYPQEYFFALKLHEWVLQLAPDASEELRLASRCQHIGRWEIARSTFPDNREGYLRWRKALATFHAEKASEILEKVGYSKTMIDRVKEIVLKKRLKLDRDVQHIENALCLVFLQYQYEDFYPLHEDKIVTILKKSLIKMDENGHRFALSLPYSEKGLQYIHEALHQLQASKHGK